MQRISEYSHVVQLNYLCVEIYIILMVEATLLNPNIDIVSTYTESHPKIPDSTRPAPSIREVLHVSVLHHASGVNLHDNSILFTLIHR